MRNNEIKDYMKAINKIKNDLDNMLKPYGKHIYLNACLVDGIPKIKVLIKKGNKVLDKTSDFCDLEKTCKVLIDIGKNITTYATM